MGLTEVLLSVECPAGPHRGYQLYAHGCALGSYFSAAPALLQPLLEFPPQGPTLVVLLGSLSTPGSLAPKLF